MEMVKTLERLAIDNDHNPLGALETGSAGYPWIFRQLSQIRAKSLPFFDISIGAGQLSGAGPPGRLAYA